MAVGHSRQVSDRLGHDLQETRAMEESEEDRNVGNSQGMAVR